MTYSNGITIMSNTTTEHRCGCGHRAASSITLLVDNKAGEGLECVHGFAAWIKIRDRRILFDTGQKDVILKNAERLGINLADAEVLVMSHGHDDHTDNLADFYAINPTAPMYCGQNIEADRFCCRPGEQSLNWSPPASAKQVFANLPPEQKHILSAPHYFLPGVAATGPVPRLTTFEDVGDALFLDAEGTRPDPVSDDMSMWFETDKGLVILLGCCHSGIVNTVNYIRKVSGVEKVSGIVGGMHLIRANEERMKNTLEAMKSWNLDWLIPCHCTGDKAMQQMKDYLGDKVTFGCTGTVIELGQLPEKQEGDFSMCKKHAHACGCGCA